MTEFRWLHWTDLHCGMRGKEWLWPNFEAELLADLERVVDDKRCGGPIDLVVFTGDLTQAGTREQFERLDEILGKLFAKLQQLGSKPALCAVPGNHDLVRIKEPDDTQEMILDQLSGWAEKARLRERFFTSPDHPARQLVREVFADYEAWWNAQSHGTQLEHEAGLLPGEYSATIEKDGTKLGIVGLNSSFLHLGNNVRGKLAVDVAQLVGACGEDLHGWFGDHDAALLLTHHPIDWFSASMQDHFRSEIYPPGRFAAHLFGHNHASQGVFRSEGGAIGRWFIQGCSLFGMSHIGDNQTERLHGQTAARLNTQPDRTTLRIWPRHAVDKHSGARAVQADSGWHLEDDEGTAPSLVRGKIDEAGSVNDAFEPGRYFDFLEKENCHVDAPGLAGDHAKLPLEQVYVRLTLRGANRSSDKGERADHSGKANERGTELGDLLADPTIAITGDPGSGKTTLLRYVALRLARFHRGRDHAAPGALGFTQSPPAPLLLRLPVLAQDLREMGALKRATLPPDAWPKILARSIAAAPDCAPEPEAIAEWLKRGSVLLLFDALDEVSGETTRRKLAEGIVALAAKYPGPEEHPNHFVVTCRTRAWGEGEAFTRFTGASIAPLDAHSVETFVARWSIAARPSRSDELSSGLLAALRASPAVRDIASNPQMLTMLAVLYVGADQLPEQRAKLYEKCIENLLSRRPEMLEPYGGSNPALLHMQALAVSMHEATDDQGNPRDALDVRDAERLLAGRLGDRDNETDREKAKELLRVLELAVGLLGARGHEVRFQHRTFQEYLVARHFADQSDPAAAIGDRALEPGWAEVVRLTAGVLASKGENGAREFLEGIVGDAQEPDAWAPRVGVAASCLPDLEAWGMHDSVLAPVRDALDRVLPVITDPESGANIETRIAVANGIGRGPDPRLESTEPWVVIPAGRFWRGAADGDEEAYKDEQPGAWVEVAEFQIRRWPVTIAEYARFVAAGGYALDVWDEEGRAWRENENVRAPDALDSQLRGPTNHPVTGVSQWEAHAFCRWLNTARRDGLSDEYEIRLPTEAEWEKAARGGKRLGDGRDNPNPQRRYPWGEYWREDHANNRPEGTTSVGLYIANREEPYGLWDIVGNVWEWCSTSLTAYPGAAEDWDSELGSGFDPAGRFAVRGGGWSLDPRQLRVSCRGGGPPAYRNVSIGFRPVAAPAVP